MSPVHYEEGVAFVPASLRSFSTRENVSVKRCRTRCGTVKKRRRRTVRCADGFPSIHVDDGLLNEKRSCAEETAIVFLRVGDLRVDDNPALHACLKSKYALPVCVLDPRDPNRQVALACAEDLQRSLRLIGSNLLIDWSASPQAVLHAYAQMLPRATIYRNQNSIHPIRLPGLIVVDLALTVPPAVPLPPPCYLPRLPPQFNFFSAPSSSVTAAWNFFASSTSAARRGRTDFEGETFALRRLVRVINAPATPLERTIVARGCHGLELLFARELLLGCISRARLHHEVEKRQRRLRSSRMKSRSRSRYPSSPSSTTSLEPVGLMSSSIGLGAVTAFDLCGSKRRSIAWDESSGQLYLSDNGSDEDALALWVQHKYAVLRRLFLPEDVTPDYYAFTAIRFVQRCISATVTVLGTQALILALGLKSGANNQAAAIAWVLKNGLGRVGKMLWAGTMGRDFDVDPKRWRFNSAIVYTLGNGMEILTQIFPGSFLFFATMAITLKQVSWLTATATRNAMYRSFGNKRDNIGDITAKGEAQIVIAELIGMAAGILLSKSIGTKKRNVIAAYVTLSLLDIIAIYQELRVVVFRTLNPQRTGLLAEEFADSGKILTPLEVSRREHIMFAPAIGADGDTFTGMLEVAGTREELDRYLDLFRKEKFIIGCKLNKKGKPCNGKQCKIVLREDVRSKDIMRAMLALGYIRRKDEATLTAVKEAYTRANNEYRTFKDEAKNAGWNTDQLLYSTLRRRCAW